MKRLAQQLTEDNLVLKNYIILASSSKFATHKFFELSDELCSELTDKVDRGQKYDPLFRYGFKCGEGNGFFKTRQGAIQSTLWNHFGDVKYLKIIKLQDDEKDIVD